jgi:hypothetical protein
MGEIGNDDSNTKINWEEQQPNMRSKRYMKDVKKERRMISEWKSPSSDLWWHLSRSYNLVWFSLKWECYPFSEKCSLKSVCYSLYKQIIKLPLKRKHNRFLVNARISYFSLCFKDVVYIEKYWLFKTTLGLSGQL